MYRSVTLALATALAVGILPKPAVAQDVALAAVAAQQCPAQWAAVAVQTPNTWDAFDPIEIDPTLDPAFTDAWNRYSVAVLALAQFIGDFAALSADTPEERPDFASAAARLDLAECLIPTEAQRATIVAVTMDQHNLSAVEASAALFAGFDGFACMGIAPASREIFDLDPTSATYLEDYQSIIERVMTPCP